MKAMLRSVWLWLTGKYSCHRMLRPLKKRDVMHFCERRAGHWGKHREGRLKWNS